MWEGFWVLVLVEDVIKSIQVTCPKIPKGKLQQFSSLARVWELKSIKVKWENINMAKILCFGKIWESRKFGLLQTSPPYKNLVLEITVAVHFNRGSVLSITSIYPAAFIFDIDPFYLENIRSLFPWGRWTYTKLCHEVAELIPSSVTKLCFFSN